MVHKYSEKATPSKNNNDTNDCHCSTCLCDIFVIWQVKTLEMSKDDVNNSVLVSAATNKNPNVFEAVLSGVEKDLTPQEVRDNAALKISVINLFEGRIHPSPAHGASST